MSIFSGSGVAIITPFNDDKSIDFITFEKLIEFQIQNSTDAIIVCGTTGEASTLSTDEHINAVKFCVDIVNNRVPVIAGSGSNSTSHSLHLSKMCQKAGVDGLLVVTPYYNKTTQKGLINHYKILAENVDLPIILYNVPSRTGLNISPETVLELSKISNIVGIKEASGDISQAVRIASICPNDFYIYTGNDDQVLPILSVGGKGVISVLANIAPKDTHDMVHSFFNGDFQKSKALQLNAIELVNSLFCEVNPIPVKTALSLMGFGKVNFREPLLEMERQDFINLKLAMEHYKLI